MFDRVFRSGQNPFEFSWDELLSEKAKPLEPSSAPALPDRDVWQRIVDGKHSTALIITPHAAVHPDFETVFDSYWSAIPQEWDVVCLGAYYATPPAHLSGHVFRPVEFTSIHGYAIRDRACAKLLESPRKTGSIEQQLASFQESGFLKIYSIWPNLICPAGANGFGQDLFNSFRQLGQHGRMGNQFFQVAATIGAAVRHGYRPQFPAWNSSQILLEHFDQALDVSRIAETYSEPRFHFSELPHTPNLDLFGFLQSPLYFRGYENLIRQYFRPSKTLAAAIETRFASLLSRPTVALHVRRADYVGLARAFVTLPMEYYRAAMRQFPEGYRFAVFSDDPAWCRAAFTDENIEVISGNPGYADLYLMSACQHQIIANSSFSWWAAYLNSNPGKRVIASKRWFGPALSQNDTRDLIPAEWVTLDGGV